MSDTSNNQNSSNQNNSQNNQNAPKSVQPPLVTTNNPNNSSISSNNPANPNNNIVRNWLSAIAGVLVVLIAVTYIIHRNDNAILASDTSTTTVMAATTTTSTTTTGAGSFAMLPNTMMTASQGESVSASNQSAGSSVTVSSLKLTRLSWVAVMAQNGSILGAGLFPASATNGTIPLQRSTVAGKSYMIVMYADNGDKAFQLHQDMLVMNTDKSPVGSTFIAQ